MVAEVAAVAAEVMAVATKIAAAVVAVAAFSRLKGEFDLRHRNQLIRRFVREISQRKERRKKRNRKRISRQISQERLKRLWLRIEAHFSRASANHEAKAQIRGP